MDIFLYSSVEGHLGEIQLDTDMQASVDVSFQFSLGVETLGYDNWLICVGGRGRGWGMLNCITKCLYHFKRK